MHYYIANALGDSVDDPSPEAMREMLDALDPNDDEHGAAWLSDEEGNSLEFNVDGTLVFSRENVGPRHIDGVTKDRTVKLWLTLSRGLLAELEGESWRPGLRSEEELARLRQRADEQQARLDRDFYDSLGLERPDKPCRRDGCSRGSVSQSVLCRVHHYESLRKLPSPFTH